MTITLAVLLEMCIRDRPEAVALLHENRIKLGGYNVKIIEGPAPEALDNLPAPDCVFVGGSGGRMRELSLIHI